MAMEIDRLEIAINAEAKNATSEIDALYAKLGDVADRLNRTSSSFRSAAKEMGRLTAAFRSLASVRIPHFDSLISQIKNLSTYLNGLQGKKVNIDIGINAPKSSSQVQWAIGKATNAAITNSDMIAEALFNPYHMTETGKKAMRSAVNAMMKELASGFDGQGFSNAAEVLDKHLNSLTEIIRKHGRVLSDSIGDEARIAEATAGKSALAISKMLENGIKTNISDIGTRITDPEIVSGIESGIRSSIVGAITNSMDGISKAFERTMKIASGKLPIDVEVNQDKITRDIQNAINKAATVEYKPIQVNLSVNKQSIRDRITEELNGVSPNHLTSVSEAYQRFLNSILQAHTALGNSDSINKVVNALARLANVDLRKFDTDKFKEITDAIAALSGMGDVSASIAKMVSALARLASVGDLVNTTAQAIPALGNALKSVFDQLSATNISDVTERVILAFTRLATSGDKAATAATNLPKVTSVIRDFFDAMAQAPDINDTTLRMVEAFTALATSGRRVGSIGNQVTKSFNDMSTSGHRTTSALSGIRSGSNSAVNALKSLLNVLKQMVKTGRTVITIFNKIAKLNIDIARSVANPVTGMKRLGTAVSSLGEKFGFTTPKVNKLSISLKNLLQVALGFYGIRTLLTWGKSAIELASDLTEVQNVVENSFGTNGTELVEKYAKTANTSFGMTELTFKQISSRYQAMGNAMGITTGEIAKANERLADKMTEDYAKVGDGMGNMSIRLTMLAADLASFYNVDQSTVAEALNAVYTGQTRPLRQYGIDLTQATLQEWANKQGIDAKVSSMTQAEKTMLRYQYVMAQTTTIQGDFARTSDTWANQVRILKQNLQALASVIGGTLINAFKPFITWLNKALGAVISFAETVGNALGKIFGWKILHTPASNAADVYDSLAEGLEDAGTSGDDAADGIDKAKKAAEEYKNTVLGFDELNKLSDPTKTASSGSGSGSGSGNGSGSGSGSGGSADGTGADFQLVKNNSWLEEYKSGIDNLFELGRYISNALSKAMESIDWQSVYEKARKFGTGLADFLNGLITPRLFANIGKTIAGAMNTVLNAADAFLDRFDFTNLGKSLASGINAFFSTYDFGLKAKVFYKSINGIAEAIKAAADDIEWGMIGDKISTCIRDSLGGIDWRGKVFPAADSLGKGLAKYLNSLINPETFGMIGSTLANVLNTALHFLDNFGSTFNFKNFGQSVANGINDYFRTWDANLTSKTFNEFALGFLESIKEALADVKWFSIGSKVRSFLVGIKWTEILKSVGTAIMGGINAALDFAKGIFDGTPVENAINKLKKNINDSLGKIDFEKLTNGLQGILDVGLEFGAGFMEGFTTALGRLAEIGAATLWGIGKAIEVIGTALSEIDPDFVKNLGSAFGTFAGSLFAFSLGKKGLDVVTGLVTSFFGLGKSAPAAADGIASTSSAMETGTAAAGGFVSRLAGVASSILMNAGVTATLTKQLEESGNIADGGLYKGLYATLVSLYQESVINDSQFTRLSNTLAISKSKSEDLETATARVSSEMQGMGISTKSLNGHSDALNKGFKELGITENDQITVLNGLGIAVEKTGTKTETSSRKVNTFSTQIENARKTARNATEIKETFGSAAETTGTKVSRSTTNVESFRSKIDSARTTAKNSASVFKDTLGGSLETVGTKAQGADTKSGTFKTNLFAFTGAIAAQSLLMAVMGTTFKGVGDKAAEAQIPIDALKNKIKEFVDSIASQAPQALTNSKLIGQNTVDGMKNYMNEHSGDISTAATKAMVTNVKTAITSGWGIHSPSSVTYGYGSDIMKGMYNAIKDNTETVRQAMMACVNIMKKDIKAAAKDFKAIGNDLAKQFSSGIKELNLSDVATKWRNQVKSSLSGLSDDLYSLGQRAGESLKKGMSTASMPKLRYTVSGWTTHYLTINGQTQTTSTPIYSPMWYKKGGFPNLGDLFFANEAGPEMVGKMGNRNVVANNMQIQEGIRSAVIDGMMQVYMATNSGDDNNLPYQFNIKMVTPDGEVLAQQVEKGMARRDMRFNPVGNS